LDFSCANYITFWVIFIVSLVIKVTKEHILNIGESFYAQVFNFFPSDSWNLQEVPEEENVS